MLGRTSNEEADIVAKIHDILTVDVETDGLTFEPASIQAERITEDADYEDGMRRPTSDRDTMLPWFPEFKRTRQTVQTKEAGRE